MRAGELASMVVGRVMFTGAREPPDDPQSWFGARRREQGETPLQHVCMACGKEASLKAKRQKTCARGSQ